MVDAVENCMEADPVGADGTMASTGAPPPAGPMETGPAPMTRGAAPAGGMAPMGDVPPTIDTAFYTVEGGTTEQQKQVAETIDLMMETDPEFAAAMQELQAQGKKLVFTIQPLNDGPPPEGSFTLQQLMDHGGVPHEDATSTYQYGEFDGGQGIKLDPAALMNPDVLMYTIAHEVAHALGHDHGAEMDNVVNSYVDGFLPPQQPDPEHTHVH